MGTILAVAVAATNMTTVDTIIAASTSPRAIMGIIHMGRILTTAVTNTTVVAKLGAVQRPEVALLSQKCHEGISPHIPPIFFLSNGCRLDARFVHEAFRQALLNSRAIVIQRYFRGFITRLRTVGALRQLQVHELSVT